MRTRFMMLAVLALVACARADTIHLKNGGTILADSVKVTNGRVEYTIGDDTYALPQSAIDHIDTEGAPSHSGGGADSAPLATPSVNVPRSDEVQPKLIRDGHVDQTMIDQLEQRGSPDLSAAANFAAGNFEYQSGDRALARRYFERALSFAPEAPGILEMYAATLIQLHLAPQAIPYAQHATRVAPNSADAFYLLGRAYFDSDQSPQAIRAWQQALALRPDANLRQALEKAQRESSAENDFSEADTGHFALHYEGGKTSDALRREILEALESDYNQLVGDLGVAPRSTIPVSLYTNQAFFDVTQAPSWAGALYDGKLRIPVDGLSSVTSDLARVLRHELTHSFVRDITRGRCPQWLNEGVAMTEEPKRMNSSIGRQLARLYSNQREIPLSSLEGSFMSLSPDQAQLAYYESLAAALYIRDTYGMSDIERVLERIGEGASSEAALRATIHSGYADLEQEVGDYLKKNYGE